jgi:hypothetical protein
VEGARFLLFEPSHYEDLLLLIVSAGGRRAIDTSAMQVQFCPPFALLLELKQKEDLKRIAPSPLIVAGSEVWKDLQRSWGTRI